MTCCAANLGAGTPLPPTKTSATELAMASREIGDGLRQTVLSVPSMHCAGCIAAVEEGLKSIPGVERARANLTLRRVAVDWRGEGGEAPDLLAALAFLGYDANLPSSLEDEGNSSSGLLRALAITGFCAMNIMLLSVSVWSGADAATRHTFHIMSALLAVPAVFYGGSAFHISAWRALTNGRANMDVPVSAGILLSFGLSLYDTANNAPHAYFEASTSLVFVLLIGRVLDQSMRRKARSAVSALTRLVPRGANVIDDGGERRYLALSEIRAGMQLAVAAGERLPADGIVMKGQSDLDAALITGESRWRRVGEGDDVRAGELNLDSLIIVQATAAPADSMVAEMTRLIEAAEDGRTRYRRLADRAAGFYAPIIHTLAALAFAIWFVATGDVHRSLTIAVAVLIITCPCALGLAVPMVQVVLARCLFDQGVMATDGSAFERLREIDTVVLDKTGTLTTGEARLLDRANIPSEILELAANLATGSIHPVARALVAEGKHTAFQPFEFTGVREIPGGGMEGLIRADVYRLGKPEWALAASTAEELGATAVLSRNGVALASFRFREQIRPGAVELVSAFTAWGFQVLLLSGDSSSAVSTVAETVAISECHARLLPADKVKIIKRLQEKGHKVLMVGDGINDAPALRAADASMSPTTASDVGRSAADFVFLAGDLRVVADIFDRVEKASRLIHQNFLLAVVYNAVSLPIAFAGYVTPLIAALAMSSSSLIVVANALRLGRGQDRTKSTDRLEQERVS